MDILTGINSPFEMNGNRESLRFSGDEHGGQFQVELKGSGCRSTIHGSWDRSDNGGYEQSGFYFDLSVVDHDPEQNLKISMSRDDAGYGKLHITNPGQDSDVAVSAPLGKLSGASNSVFEPDFFDFGSVTDVMVEADGEAICLSIYRQAEPQTPVRFVVRDGKVALETT